MASCIVNHRAVAEVMAIASPSHFHNEPLRFIYATILDLWGGKEKINLITVAHALSLRQDPSRPGVSQLETVGGQLYLADICRRLPTSDGAEWYAKLVVRDAIRRQGWTLAIALGRAFAERDDPYGIIEEFSGQLLRLGQDRQRPDTLSVAEILDGVEGVTSALRPKLLLDQREYIKTEGIGTGWERFDEILNGLQRGHLYTVLGRTNQGKSFLVNWIAWSVAKQNLPVHIVSTEMPFSEVVERLAFLEAGINPEDYDRMDEDMVRNMEDALNRLEGYPIHVTSVGSVQVKHLVAKVRRNHELHGTKLVIVDTFQKLKGEGDNAEQRARDGITALKGLAIDCDIPIIAVSHISRESARNAINEQRRISVHDALHSGAIEQESDQVIALEPVHYDDYRKSWHLLSDAQYNKFQSENRWVPIQLTVLKHRQGQRQSAERLLSWATGGNFEPIRNNGQVRLPG